MGRSVDTQTGVYVIKSNLFLMMIAITLIEFQMKILLE